MRLFPFIYIRADVRRAPRRWLGDSAREARWLCARAVVGYGGIAFGFLSVPRMALAESQVLRMTSPLFAAFSVSDSSSFGGVCNSSMSFEAAGVAASLDARISFMRAAASGAAPVTCD